MPAVRGRKSATAPPRRSKKSASAGRLTHLPNALSGGEQQRVGLARALVAQPKLLLADEPTGNLDQDTGEKMIELMFSLARDRGTAILLITHDHVSRTAPTGCCT